MQLTLLTAKAGGFLIRRSQPASRAYTVSPKRIGSTCILPFSIIHDIGTSCNPYISTPHIPYFGKAGALRRSFGNTYYEQS